MQPATPAESQLLHAAETDTSCDLSQPGDPKRPSADVAAGWGEDRVVRAEYLRHLIIDRALPISLRGARITGDLDLTDRAVGPVVVPQCVFTGGAGFEGATFTGGAGFEGATFIGDAVFNGAIFTGDAVFYGATFTGSARFTGATFTGPAVFNGATFTGSARFTGATFTDDALFNNGATFTGGAGFEGATFTGDAGFNGAIFTDGAVFYGATFTGDAWFDGATFTDGAWFDGVRCRWLVWRNTVWSGGFLAISELAAVSVLVDGAVVECPGRWEFTAASVSAVRLRAMARLHLVVAGGSINVTDADLVEGSVIEGVQVLSPPVDESRWAGHVPGGGVWVAIPATETPSGKSRRPAGVPAHAWLGYVQSLIRLDRELTETLMPGRPASVVSVQRAHVAGVTFTGNGLDLRECVFTDGDGLDELVLSSDSILTHDRDDLPTVGKWRRANRRVIADELVWRRHHTSTVGDDTRAETSGVSARAVSGTYRSLRKALEDNKDEPGAADFYYGEMHMRRAASRAWSSVEWWLLSIYWLVSGYGLRAWRAIAALVVVIAVAGWCFTNDHWAQTRTTAAPTSVNLHTGEITTSAPTPEGLPLERSWLFAAQETIALFRPAGASDVVLTGAGAYIDLALRVLGPLFLALAVLAIRNRTKR